MLSLSLKRLVNFGRCERQLDQHSPMRKLLVERSVHCRRQ